jgi:phage terminase Nu1 subunit (DNA packaging protein)
MEFNEKLTFTQAEAAALLDVSRRTLNDWGKLKKPVPYRSGGRGKPSQYDGRELVAWYVEHRLRQFRYSGRIFCDWDFDK